MNVRSGLDMICVGRDESSSEIQIGKGWAGMRGPFGMTPGCIGMFAHMAKDEVEEIISANLSRYHRVDGFDEQGFRKAVTTAMKTGYGTYDDIILDRTTSAFGIAIRDPSGYPIAGIGTTYITGRLNEKQRQQCVKKLKQTTKNISKRLFPGSV